MKWLAGILLLLMCALGIAQIGFSIDCFLVDCNSFLSHCRPESQVSALVLYGLDVLCCALLLWINAYYCCPLAPWAHLRHLWRESKNRLPEVNLWLTTAAVLTAVIYSSVAMRLYLEPLSICVASFNGLSVLLNSISASYSNQSNLAPQAFTRITQDREASFDYHALSTMADLVDPVEQTRKIKKKRLQAGYLLLYCMLVHNGILFLSTVISMFALVSKHEDNAGHRVMMILDAFAVWYRLNQAQYWFLKCNDPSANVMAPTHAQINAVI